MRPKLLRPTVELFVSPPPLSSVDLYRAGAFARPMAFPFKRLRTFPDRIEIYWRDRNRPAQIIWLEWRPLHLGGAFPYFICYRCNPRGKRRRACAKADISPCHAVNDVEGSSTSIFTRPFLV